MDKKSKPGEAFTGAATFPFFGISLTNQILSRKYDGVIHMVRRV